MRVALIPTGRMELAALPQALTLAFPGHEFHAVGQTPDGSLPMDGFTSTDVSPLLDTDRPRSNLDELIARLASEVYPGRRRRDSARNDGAILIDDLELANKCQPEKVVRAVRGAVQRHLDGLSRGSNVRDRTRTALLKRASFHLAVPMAEAWFYPDEDALRRAGVPSDRLPPALALAACCDPEHFLVEDEDYESDDGSNCTAMHQANQRRGGKPRKAPWLRTRRQEHPKAYLEWLARDADDRRCTTYRESNSGVAALRALSWAEVLSNQDHFRYARAFLNDLADFLGEDEYPGEEADLTTRFLDTRENVLRNI